jgi:hypothetical protein
LIFRSIIVALIVPSAIAHADSSATPSDSDVSGEQPRYALALGEILGNNLVVNLVDRTIPSFDWADSDFETSWDNIKGPWGIYDEASFSITQIQHPIQGSFYFIAGRSNGLNFWESAAGTAFGATTWKIFGEVDDSNINSIVTTTLGGISLGEMLHRLYIEADRQGSIARFFVSPLDAGNDAVFGKDWDNGAYGRVSLSLEAGLVVPYLDLDSSQGVVPGIGNIAGEVGDTLIYGDPYGDRSAPFDYFEQRLNIALSSSFYGLSFFSNGTLFSLPVVDDQQAKLSLASCLHYDYIYSSFIELEASAVGLSLIGEQHTTNHSVLKGEVHLNAVVLGADENEYFRELNGVQGMSENGRDYDFCLGGDAKLYLSASQPLLGTLSLEFTCYDFRGIPGVSVSCSPPAPLDYSIVGMLNLSYEHDVVAHLRIGMSYLLYFKDAFYYSLPAINDSIKTVTLYLKWFS